jgi:hypothetical protein
MLLSPGFHIEKGYGMRPYQIRAAHKIFTGTPQRDFKTGKYVGPSCDGTNVHVDMGLGKTITALTAIADLYRFGVCQRPTLIVAPIMVCETVWRQEAKAWTHTCHLKVELLRGDERQRAYTLHRAFDTTNNIRHTDVLLINPELLPWLYKWLRNDWSFFDVLIIDDVSLKSHKSKQFRTLTNYGRRDHPKDPMTGKALRDAEGRFLRWPPHRFKRSAKLTGTPTTTGLHNLWSTNYIMDHGARLHADYDTFEGRFFHKGKQVAPHVHEIEINAEEAESRPEYVAREGAPERIHELLADITIELDGADYGVLPDTIGDATKSEPPQSHLHRVQLPGDLREKYDELEREAILELGADVLMAQNGGAKSMMCWQIANGAIYKTDDFGRKEVHELHDAKLDKLVELIERTNTNVIVPYYFQHDYSRIVTRLHKEGMHFTSLKGNRKQQVIDEWNNGSTPILLLHPQSAGHGLNLQFGGNTIIWFTMLWSLERYLQTNARIARSGQASIVHIHSIVTERTTDELMLINLRQNGDTQTRFRAAIREYQQLKGINYV